MAKVTKAQLEEHIKNLENELKQYKNWLMESENKYNDLLEMKDEQLNNLPAYKQMKNHVERLEFLNKEQQGTIEWLQHDNKHLKEYIDSRTLIEHNIRKAGRKPKSKEQLESELKNLEILLKEGKDERSICKTMKISRATYYRLKRNLKAAKK
ncbi:hypothetical protein [uncultured Alistipes sp.]|uniref:hypothetical protein n=1 Tax=uncultured Alistipes sp. TaxID=538949 RepID=UPI002AB136B3|nr:hypothetical protein [uncultured Alistipes sp.]